MTEKSLYEDGNFIVYYCRPPYDHAIFIKYPQLGIGEGEEFSLPRGVLEELATTDRDRIESKIYNLNPRISEVLENQRISLDGLHVAICQAYIAHEKIAKFDIKKQKNLIRARRH